VIVVIEKIIPGLTDHDLPDTIIQIAVVVHTSELGSEMLMSVSYIDVGVTYAFTHGMPYVPARVCQSPNNHIRA
jgi:hypothetical protein